jgi:transcriptional regulator with XRE-family HTH domain
MELGEKLRGLRLSNQITIKELSQRSGVSKSLISQIERGASVPTVTKLMQVAKALEVPVSTLLPDDDTSSDAQLTDVNETGSDDIAIVRMDRRKKLVMPWGGFYEMLCPDLQQKMEFIYLHYPVGTKVDDLYTHDGEECGLVLEGKFKGIFGNREIILEPGDSIYYKSSIPHRWENAGEVEVKAIWVITPPSF